VLAALRAHMDTIILPERNAKDLDDIPKELRHKVRFVLVKAMDQVLTAALEPAAESK